MQLPTLVKSLFRENHGLTKIIQLRFTSSTKSTLSASEKLKEKEEKKNISKYFIDKEEKYGAHNYHPLPVVIEKAKG